MSILDNILCTTDRLVIRQFEFSDWKDAMNYTSDELHLVYEAWGPYNQFETQEYISRILSAYHKVPQTYFSYAICLKDSGKLIGATSLRRKLNNLLTAELGYIIIPEYCRKGYAFEAMNKILKEMHIIQGIDKYYATCDVLNVPSQKLLLKLGFSIVDTLRNHIEMKGRMRDSYKYIKLV